MKLALLVAIIAFSAVGVVAQSNVTDILGITSTDQLTTNSGPNNYGFGTIRTKLTAAGADCFLITASYESGDFPPMPVGDKQKVYSFTLNSNLIFEVGATNIGGDLRWYITRPTGISQIGKSINLDYEIYDDLGVDGTFTFIFGHYFTAIAVDDGSSNFKLAPVFFGMDSNLGTLSSHMGEFTGETSNNYSRSVYIHRTSKTWKMSGDAKMATLIAALNTNNGNIENARFGKKLQEEILEEAALPTDLVLYPNPSDGTFQLDFTLEEDGPVNFRMLNLSGQTVLNRELEFSKGNHQYLFEQAGTLSKGLYVLEIVTNEFAESRQLIVK